MSRHYHAYSEAETLEHDVNIMTANELERFYGIQFVENPDEKKGKVWDTVFQKEYPSLSDWVTAQIEREKWSDNEHHQISRKFDEDF